MKSILFSLIFAAIILALVVLIIFKNIKDYKDYIKSFNAANDIIEMNSEPLQLHSRNIRDIHS